MRPSHFYQGLLDDVSIYDHALSDSEIVQRAQGYEGRYEYQHANALGSVVQMGGAASRLFTCLCVCAFTCSFCVGLPLL